MNNNLEKQQIGIQEADQMTFKYWTEETGTCCDMIYKTHDIIWCLRPSFICYEIFNSAPIVSAVKFFTTDRCITIDGAICHVLFEWESWRNFECTILKLMQG